MRLRPNAVDGKPLKWSPEGYQLVPVTFAAVFGFDGVGIAHEDQLAGIVEPPIRGGKSEIAILDARAQFLAFAFDEATLPGGRHTTGIIGMEALAPIAVDFQIRS